MDRAYLLKTNDVHYVVALRESAVTAYLLPTVALPPAWDRTPLANVLRAVQLQAAQNCAAAQGLRVQGSFVYLVAAEVGIPGHK